MKITFLGTGTSHGIPVINCTCKCCTSSDPKDTRWRSSIKVEANDGTTVVVDTGPEFRLQALKYGLSRLDAVFFTHSHADHVHGLDDVRIFAHVNSESGKSTPPLDIYANSHTNNDIRNRFDYVFKTTQMGGGKPALNLVDCEKFSIENPICVGSLQVVPIPMLHGKIPTTGWMFKDSSDCFKFAYLTDCNFIPVSSIELVKNCNSVVVDALRSEVHQTHFNFAEATRLCSQMNGKNFYFIHMTHDKTDSEIQEEIAILKKDMGIAEDVNITTSYDGLVLNL